MNVVNDQKNQPPQKRKKNPSKSIKYDLFCTIFKVHILFWKRKMNNGWIMRPMNDWKWFIGVIMVFFFIQISWAKRNDTKYDIEYGSTTAFSCFLLLQCKNMSHQRQNQTMHSTTCYGLLFLFLLEHKWGKWVAVNNREQLQDFPFDLCLFHICRLSGLLAYTQHVAQ